MISHMRLLRGQISGDHGLHQGRPKQLNDSEELDIAITQSKIKIFSKTFHQ